MERDLRLRTHAGALSHFYLDAFLGLVAIHAHGAQPAVRREHESLLSEWARAGFNLQRTVISLEAIQFLTGFGLAIWLLASHLARSGDSGAVLLLVYWALNLPHSARKWLSSRGNIRRIATSRSVSSNPSALSIIASLTPRQLSPPQKPPRQSNSKMSASRPPATQFSIESISPSTPANTSPSSAHRARENPAWSDPARMAPPVLRPHLSGSEELENLASNRCDPTLPGLTRPCNSGTAPCSTISNTDSPDAARMPIGEVIDAAGLRRVLERLPEGIDTPLGEGGGLVSGGEGQRVQTRPRPATPRRPPGDSRRTLPRSGFQPAPNPSRTRPQSLERRHAPLHHPRHLRSPTVRSRNSNRRRPHSRRRKSEGRGPPPTSDAASRARHTRRTLGHHRLAPPKAGRRHPDRAMTEHLWPQSRLGEAIQLLALESGLPCATDHRPPSHRQRRRSASKASRLRSPTSRNPLPRSSNRNSPKWPQP